MSLPSQKTVIMSVLTIYRECPSVRCRQTDVPLCKIVAPSQDVRASSAVKETRLQNKIAGFTLRLPLLRKMTVQCQLSRRMGKPTGGVKTVAKENYKMLIKECLGQKVVDKWIVSVLSTPNIYDVSEGFVLWYSRTSRNEYFTS